MTRNLAEYYANDLGKPVLVSTLYGRFISTLELNSIKLRIAAANKSLESGLFSRIEILKNYPN